MWAAWPEAGEVDVRLIHASEYLDSCLKDFAEKKAAHSTSSKIGGASNEFPCSETLALEYVSHSDHANELMTFAEKIKKNVEKHGLKALDASSNVDEMNVLRTNFVFIAKILGLESVDERPVDDASDDIKEICCPGKPCITFYTKVSISLSFLQLTKLRF
ncbi:leucine--tRNA ligase, cytoplasmic [Plakobranchus ocellatus]|uniref:Leucine--tRNA ligase, cytoplasmic n=1 Tax=Plakobranchus ocellatus TaxID=259542 RepID=A0AAV3ZVV1_9GAST|nr:leucine--tRNA ligase, cytoplasmic [Plakobranchus ocellatus]